MRFAGATLCAVRSNAVFVEPPRVLPDTSRIRTVVTTLAGRPTKLLGDRDADPECGVLGALHVLDDVAVRGEQLDVRRHESKDSAAAER